jgi:glycosyltransferase involved in cell wall biosynthesis
MKIVHLMWTFGVGGAEEMLADIANEQCRTEQVWIIILNDEIDDFTRTSVDPSVKVLCLRRKPGSRSIWPFARLNWLVRRIRPDIIHAHSSSLVKPLLGRLPATVLTVHATREAATFDRSIRRFTRIFAISKGVADDCMKTKGVPSRIVMNGIRCGDVRIRPRANDGCFRIVQIARLAHPCKGQDVLLRAIARIRAQGAGERLSLDLIGDGESRLYLENMVRDLELEDMVTLRGNIPRAQLYEELCDYDLLVQPSRFEGFGLAVVEAMVARVPVLVSDLEGPREIIEGGLFGLLFRPEEDAECARQIQYILKTKDSAAMMELKSAAREHALEKFDIKRTASRYLEEYREILSMKGGTRRGSHLHVPAEQLLRDAGSQPDRVRPSQARKGESAERKRGYRDLFSQPK